MAESKFQVSIILMVHWFIKFSMGLPFLNGLDLSLLDETQYCQIQVQEAIEEVIEMLHVVGEEQVADTTECKLVLIAFGVALICFVILFLPPSYLMFSFL